MLKRGLIGAGGTIKVGWNISNAAFLRSFNVSAQQQEPYDVFFKPDGLKMYVIGTSFDTIDEYSLGTAWNISTAVFLSSLSIGGAETEPRGLFFKPDGTKMYFTGTSGDRVREYNLSTAWNLSTAVFLRSFSIAAMDGAITGLYIKPDGTKMYVLGVSSSRVLEYDLTTAWDVSTSVFLRSFAVTNGYGLFFKPDGTKMYVTRFDANPASVYEYALSSPWDVTSAVYLQNHALSPSYNYNGGLYLNSDGSKMYVTDVFNSKVNEYALAT